MKKLIDIILLCNFKQIFMKNFKLLLAFCFLAVISFFSCEKENILENPEPEQLTSEKKLLKETSLLIGNIFKSQDVQKEFLSKMNDVGYDNQSVSLSYLLDRDDVIKKNELSAFNKKSSLKSKNLFKIALQKEFQENSNKYPIINDLVNTQSLNLKSSSKNDVIDQLTKSLASKELQIFYPYSNEYDTDSKSLTDYYVSYDPLDGSDTNEGFHFTNQKSARSNNMMIINNDFIDENPVFLVVPIDNCDIEGRICEFDDVNPIGGGNDDSLPPYTGRPKPLTYNVNHKDVPEGDILSSRIPMIKINGTSWMGFAGTHQKLAFHRGSVSGTTALSSGQIVASASSYPVKYIRVKRKYIKRKLRWVGFNAEFDPDWDMSENTQAFAVFSVHHMRGEASTESSVKVGMKTDSTGTLVPTVEPTVTTKVTMKQNSSKYRFKVELSRRQILSTITGKGLTNQTIRDKSIDYNVKKIGIVDFYFKFWHTDLTK